MTTYHYDCLKKNEFQSLDINQIGGGKSQLIHRKSSREKDHVIPAFQPERQVTV